MLFTEDIKKNTAHIKTGYDLIAYCYFYINKATENQSVFLGEYIEVNAKAQAVNPNLSILYQLSIEIKYFFKTTGLTIFTDSFQDLLTVISSTEKELVPYGDDSLNAATIPFFILNGLNLFFQDCMYETFNSAPLNEYWKDFCLVYINGNAALMDKVITRREYPKTIPENGIRQCFSRIIIMETREIPDNFGIPQMVTLNKENEQIRRIVESNKIKIVLIPTRMDACLDFSPDRGAAFSVKYDEKKLEALKERVLTLLNWAIERKANIIVFPEYICKEEIQYEIGSALAERNEREPEKLENLLFVVAGSSWTKDSNNVSCLYSYDGYLLGKVYKHSAYDKAIEGERYIESLRNPGKEITLVKIPEIGISQIAICRDLSEDNYSARLAQTFRSQFLLAPAWSSSLNIGFQTQMDGIISKNHKTCALTSNCCSALKDDRKEVNIIAAPQKKKSIVKGHFKYAGRKKCHICGKNGCIFEVCYDFNGTRRQDVGISCRQFTRKP